MVTDVPTSDLCQASGLVFRLVGLLGRDLPPMASGQRLSYGHDGRFPVALEDDLIATTPGMPPGLKFLVHVFYQPAVVPFRDLSPYGPLLSCTCCQWTHRP